MWLHTLENYQKELNDRPHTISPVLDRILPYSSHRNHFLDSLITFSKREQSIQNAFENPTFESISHMIYLFQYRKTFPSAIVKSFSYLLSDSGDYRKSFSKDSLMILQSLSRSFLIAQYYQSDKSIFEEFSNLIHGDIDNAT